MTCSAHMHCLQTRVPLLQHTVGATAAGRCLNGLKVERTTRWLNLAFEQRVSAWDAVVTIDVQLTRSVCKDIV